MCIRDRAYTHRCGVEITAAQAESLLRSCEGWFSAVYLNLHALAERGSLLQPGSDIYAMFTAAMLESLPDVYKRQSQTCCSMRDIMGRQGPKKLTSASLCSRNSSGACSGLPCKA